MNKIIIVARILLGLPFLVFGLNGFFEFMEQPEHGPEATKFLGALVDSGYLMPLLKGTEVACGALLVLGLFVPLALTVLAPVMVNILGYHLGLGEPGVELIEELVGDDPHLPDERLGQRAAVAGEQAALRVLRVQSAQVPLDRALGHPQSEPIGRHAFEVVRLVEDDDIVRR